jgi:very-short-patch-repair endonuclease
VRRAAKTDDEARNAQRFLAMCRAWDLPEPEQECRCIPKRRFRFDFAWPAAKVAVEIQGGIWSPDMAHGRGWGIQRDYTKLNLAQAHGWIVLQLSTTQLRDAPGPFMDLVKRALEQRR